MSINYFESIKATRDNIAAKMVDGLEGIPALHSFELALENGQDHWAEGECYYGSEGEQMLAYGYGVLEQMGVTWLVVEVSE